MHLPAIDQPAAAPPVDRQLPAGATAFPVVPEGVRLRFPTADGATHLRFAVALDTRDERVVAIADSQGRELARTTVAYACPYQVYSVPLSGHAEVVLRLAAGPEPLWVIGSFAGAGGEVLAPHLLRGAAHDRWAAMHDRLASAAGLHPFGWLWGCVAAGLEDLHRRGGDPRFRDALRAQAARFWIDGRIDYDDPHSRARVGYHSIEATLPAAIMARHLGPGPDEAAIAFWRAHLRADGLVCDGQTISTEGSYTIAWPMAELAAARGDDAMLRLAVEQVRARFRILCPGGRIHQRASVDGSGLHLPGWARAAAWQLLGAARTLAAMPAGRRPTELCELLQRTCATAVREQRDDGLWGNFLGEDCLPDTSGSAGIAAALAIGVRAGLLAPDLLPAARRARAGLEAHLTPDGLLGGCAQLNRGGEALQRSAYRVISQMGMGLAAQLDAALSEPS